MNDNVSSAMLTQVMDNRIRDYVEASNDILFGVDLEKIKQKNQTFNAFEDIALYFKQELITKKHLDCSFGSNLINFQERKDVIKYLTEMNKKNPRIWCNLLPLLKNYKNEELDN